MKVALNWIKEYVNIPEDPAEVARVLTEHSFESSIVKEESKVSLDKIFIGEVREVVKHPNADRLSLTKVRVRKKDYAIVCGAPNVRVGILVAVAFPGVQVLDKNDQLVTLTEAEIRGVKSEGMLCSERELGLGDGHAGIMELPKSAIVGSKLSSLYPEEVMLEADVLPDRAPDCSSHIGIAREIGAILGKKAKLPLYSLKKEPKKPKFKITVENKADCSRYVATVISAIKNGPSPDWMQKKLRMVGVKPQNLLVDVTNYVLWEMGQPTHVFDAGAIQKTIGIRQSKKGETLVTLDDVSRILPEGVLIITSDDKPIALAGIMGGKDSRVKETTNSVILEAAHFSPARIRRGVSVLGLRTDASDRFIKGVTADHVLCGTARVVELLKKYGGAKVEAQIDYQAGSYSQPVITVDHQQIEDVLGVRIQSARVKIILSSLGFKVVQKNDKYKVTAPIFRNDITIPENVVEEVGRVMGYDRLPAVLPKAPVRPAVLPVFIKSIRTAQDTLKGAGWYEVYLYSFIQDAEARAIGVDEGGLKLLNPIRSDQSLLRTSLLPNLLRVSAAVVKKEAFENFYEIGNVYGRNKLETTRLGGVTVRRGERKGEDFYKAKGTVENILEELKVKDVRFVAETVASFLDESMVIKAGTKEVGYLGYVSQEVLNRLNIRGSVVVFEVDLSVLEELEKSETVYNPPFPFPTVERDVTLIVPNGVLVDQVQTEIAAIGGDKVLDVDFVDIFDEDGKRSLTLRITYGSREKTLTDHEVNEAHSEVLKAVELSLGVREKVSKTAE